MWYLHSQLFFSSWKKFIRTLKLFFLRIISQNILIYARNVLLTKNWEISRSKQFFNQFPIGQLQPSMVVTDTIHHDICSRNTPISPTSHPSQHGDNRHHTPRPLQQEHTRQPLLSLRQHWPDYLYLNTCYSVISRLEVWFCGRMFGLTHLRAPSSVSRTKRKLSLNLPFSFESLIEYADFCNLLKYKINKLFPVTLEKSEIVYYFKNK